MMKKKELNVINQEDYLRGHLNMTPAERLKKCFELSEWSVKLNQYHSNELELRINDGFILK